MQQPGMTGQVKEDVISRFYELGFYVNDGKIIFEPTVLRKNEFIDEEKSFKFVNLDNEITYMDLGKNSLAYTICQVPIIYNLSDNESIKIIFHDNSEINIKNPPTIVFVSGTSFIPNTGTQTQKIPPITSVKDNKVNSAAGITFDPIEYKIKPKQTNVPCKENNELL